MKAMIFSDLITMRRSLAQLFGITAVVTVILAVTTGTLATMAACTASMIPVMFMFSISAYDEMNKWESFRLAMPMSRANVVAGRYASLLLVTAASLAASMAYSFAIAGVAALLSGGMGPGSPLSSLILENNPPEMVVGSGLLGMVAVLLVAAVTLPFIMRFGVTRATRLLPLVVLLGVAGGVWLIGDEGPLAAALPAGARWLLADGGFVTLVAVIVAVALVLYAASVVISLRVYAKREL